MSLKAQAVSGVKWTAWSTLLITAFQFAQLSILARLLDPADFGLMAVMMVVIGFSQAFQDMGISNAIIQRQNITHTQLSSLYWLNIASGIVLCLIVMAISPLAADFFDEPRISGLMKTLSGVFILVAIGNQYRVLCQKALQFRYTETIDIIAAAGSLVVAVYFALQGAGVLALVYAMLAQAGLASALFLWVGLREYHRPSLVYRHAELKGFYGFGLYQMGDRCINYLATNADKLLIGKMVGMSAAGFYNLAWQLIIFPVSKINPIVTKVAFPVYSKVQNDFTALNRYYTFNVKALSLVTLPILAFLFFFSHDVVRIVFGTGWSATAELIPALALVGMLRALGNPGGAIVLALGRADVGFWWNVVWSVSIVTALTLGLMISPSAHTAVNILVALSITLGTFWHVIIARISKVDYWPIARHFFTLFTVVMAIGWAGASLVEGNEINNPVLRLVSGGLFCILTYVVYLYLFEKEIFKILRNQTNNEL
ncbi:MOP flippase family protein [Halopseudomonas salegens]|uniref:Polysaccharide transporter, PST family/teichuronic acid exporter n=1 Tax=Halopseudomonas salegens TaxID=1434072 RepID=A0A1H2FLS6_9GAMM|nr:MOP flippase family protein [Halopseudomonas salegens]SDU08303.1 polysaccharide transporter, PST family/teichuronic acid exporter [Halopseudomonas salegens]